MSNPIKDPKYYPEAIVAQYPTVKLHRVTKISKNDGREIYPDYWVLGELQMGDYKIGGKISVWRLANSDHPEGRLGEFTSSEIMEIQYGDFDLVRTQNSVYKVEELNNMMDVICNCEKGSHVVLDGGE